MAKRAVSKLEELRPGTTYRCCNYDIPFGSEWFTPVKIDLETRTVVYEDATRHQHTKKFKDHCDEAGFFSFNNMWAA